ncbi:YpjP-like protein [Streptohalobacillus salinus]|uniref:YpjP-like protein n=1 Tax=Streptohalobacillus salinus TaxID=621096 RepID=A0A2V3WF21_9BACI|nr:YpjP family protein [Streptohalobacillus salinus]PXW92188.1 YpjP-like protein [Streptohalobacillus salinus]
MQVWVKKLFVATVAVMTLGMYVPSIDLEVHADVDSKEYQSAKPKELQSNHYEAVNLNEEPEAIVTPSELLKEQATAQVIGKIGPRILQPIEQEMKEEILPNVETVIDALVEQYDPHQLFNLSLIEQQTAGYGERIFDIYDEQSEQLIAKFHVRRDNRPKEGYWFNFHYHLIDDNFEHHYTIGDVSYGKNTPPKWMG